MLIIMMIGFAALAVVAGVRLRGPGRLVITVGFAILALGPLVEGLLLAASTGPLPYLIGNTVTWVPGWICVAVGVVRAGRPVAAPAPGVGSMR